MKNTRFYGIWKAINGRCYTPSNRAYKRYGARGITSEWRHSFLAFHKDMHVSYQEHVQKHGEYDTTIERKDVNGNYTKDNCRWATRQEQSENKTCTQRIEVDGKIYTYKEAAKQFGLTVSSIRQRHKRGASGFNLIRQIPKTKPVCAFKNGVVTCYASLTAAAKAVGGNHSMLVQALQRTGKAYGYKWKLAN